MELFEEIRREYQFGVGTIKGVARKLGVHRRQVRQALADAVPPVRRYRPRVKPRLGPVQSFIDAILEADRTAPRKQRHTAHRIHQRLADERATCPVAESTVRQYVRDQKRARGWGTPATCVPQSYAWGQEAQVDWYEAAADVAGERTTQQVFCMRSMASGAAFHCAYPRATQQAFLEAHERAFQYFGGVFATLRYDNLTSAVRKILRGFRRDETVRFIAFRSHWQFQAAFCTPGEAHEKGGVEGEGGYFRRNHWVPVPQAVDLAALNAQLLAGCQQDEARLIAGRSERIGAALAIERGHLRPLATEPFDLLDVTFPTVDGHGCVRVKTNAYSVPAPVGTAVEVKLGPAYVDVWWQGTRVARHERSYGRFQSVLNLEHYLDVLERKPGALAGSTPLAQWRARGLWPASYDALWTQLMTRQGPQAGTRAMIAVLQLGRTYGATVLQTTVETALALGCADAAAIHHLLSATSLARGVPDALALGALTRYDRPLPELHQYDTLLRPVVPA